MEKCPSAEDREDGGGAIAGPTQRNHPRANGGRRIESKGAARVRDLKSRTGDGDAREKRSPRDRVFVGRDRDAENGEGRGEQREPDDLHCQDDVPEGCCHGRRPVIRKTVTHPNDSVGDTGYEIVNERSVRGRVNSERERRHSEHDSRQASLKQTGSATNASLTLSLAAKQRPRVTRRSAMRFCIRSAA